MYVTLRKTKWKIIDFTYIINTQKPKPTHKLLKYFQAERKM